MNDGIIRRLAAIVVAAAALSPIVSFAADEARPLADVLDLDATVTTDVVPDLAVVTMAIVREGPEVAPLTADVNQALAKAFADARAVPAVTASNGGYSTSPRYETRGSQNTQTGWTVRAQVVVKSKDFAALGALVGRLGQSLQIAGSGFEISPGLRAQESAALVDRAARAFLDKAAAATKAFGYAGFTIRQVTLGSAGESSAPRPMARMVASSSAAPLPLEAGPATLSLTVSGSVQMHR